MEQRKRKRISNQTRVQILARDNYKCRMCGKTSSEVKLVVDHIYPYSMGGTDDLDNLASLCEECNNGKSDLLFRAALKAKVEANDFSPYQLPTLNIGFTRNGDGRRHNYNLLVKVVNTTSKSIHEPQIEVVLPTTALVTPSSRGDILKEGIYTKVFFGQLDVGQIHPNRTVSVMGTSNIGLVYKMDSDMHDDPAIMTANFIVTLFGKDIQPIQVKKRFSDMQEF